LNAGIIWTFNDRYWADFEPNTRTNANDKTEPYRIPSYNLVNISANYHLPINVTQERPLALDIFINVNNLFDEMYIERGKDGADHTLDTFTGYWGQGINFNCGLKISF
jgi:outer membrane receptor protein involved in Fe transport